MACGTERRHQQRRQDRARLAAGLLENETPNRRAENLSEDEGELSDTNLDAIDPDASSTLTYSDATAYTLVQDAIQSLGNCHTDGAALAIAAIQQSNPNDAFRLLAASSAKANLDAQQVRHHASHAVVTADLASEGVINPDVTENRYKRQNAINDQVDEICQQQQQLIIAQQNRLARLEGVISRVLNMLLSNGADANQIEEMLRELNSCNKMKVDSFVCPLRHPL